MKALARFAVMIGGAAAFAGCGGSQPPIAVPLQGATTFQNLREGGTWQIFSISYGGGAQGIVRGKVGDYWVADGGGPEPYILRVSPHGKQKAFRTGLSPDAITADRQGALWFTNPRLLNTISRFSVNSKGGFQITLGDNTNGGIILGGDGDIWVSQESHIARVTHEGKFKEFATPYAVAGATMAWARNRVWFISGVGFASLNPTNGKVIQYAASIENPGGMVAASGSLYAMGTRLVVFDLKTKSIATYVLPSHFIGAPSPQNLALAPDGSLWYAAQRLSRNRKRVIGGGLVRFNPSTHHFTVYVSPNGVPWSCCVTVAPNGEVWATASDFITVLSLH
jgi:streptogramin lyase